MVKSENLTAPLEGFNHLPLVRQLALMIGLAASIALVVVAVMWTQEEGGKSVLYSGLAPEDASQVVQSLQQQGVDYKVNDATGAIMVPSDKVHEVRLQLAGDGLPKGGGVGFDLLQKEQEFGASQFIQNKRYQHALETELARSVTSVGHIKSARVHLALPEQSAFIRKRRDPTASVVVDLYPGRRLEAGQVDSITHLVASSIPEMSPGKVTVVDQRGRLLTGQNGDGNAARNEQQFDYVNKVEQRYADRIENILTPIVGYEGVRAQVTAAVDFSVTERTQETYNPDMPAPRSKQTMEEVTANGGPGGVPGALANQPPAEGQVPEQVNQGNQGNAGQGQQGEGSAFTFAGSQNGENGETVDSRRETTVNYELDRTISHTESAPGRLQRLSVAVVVDDRKVTNEDGELVREPWPEGEIERITGLVKEAVGYNPRRGDTVNVINASFQEQEEVAPVPEPPLWERAWVWDVAKKVGAGIIVLLLILGVLRPLLRSLAAVKPAAGVAAGPTEEEGEQLGEDQLSLSGGGGGSARLPKPEQQYEEDLNVARQLAQEDPKRVAQVVRTWLTSE
ncbi:MAG TPA: flagellar basal-body MS-ring/collar protein FliF [Gammaproteobacteria bacterium]|nr:flagellar basal-body MS-ring/collar protein FliF [Gammaproteobacteria bacterium]